MFLGCQGVKTPMDKWIDIIFIWCQGWQDYDTRVSGKELADERSMWLVCSMREYATPNGLAVCAWSEWCRRSWILSRIWSWDGLSRVGRTVRAHEFSREFNDVQWCLGLWFIDCL